MNCRNKSNTRRSASLAAGAVSLGLLLGLPGGAAADCTPAQPTRGHVSGQDVAANPPGETAVQTCSPFDFRDIGRRH